jgi:hypothetical protein
VAEEFNTVDARHAHVSDDATGLDLLAVLQEGRGGFVETHMQAV